MIVEEDDVESILFEEVGAIDERVKPLAGTEMNPTSEA